MRPDINWQNINLPLSQHRLYAVLYIFDWKGYSLFRSVSRMDADAEPTGMYLRRLL